MSAVRGMPQTPPAEPTYEKVSSNILKRKERRETETRNFALKYKYDEAVQDIDRIARLYNKGLSTDSAKTTKGNTPELAAASYVRDKLAHREDPTIARYDNPAEYVADLWADGYLSDEKARALLDELHQNGEVTITDSDDSVKNFLLQEERLGHISTKEREMMMAWEKRQDITQDTEDLTELRQHLIELALEKHQGVDKSTAVKLAMQTLQELQENGALSENLQDNPNPELLRIETPQPENLPPPLPPQRSELREPPTDREWVKTTSLKERHDMPKKTSFIERAQHEQERPGERERKMGLRI